MGETTPKIFRLKNETAERLEAASDGTGISQTKIVEDALALYSGQKPDGVDSRQVNIRSFLSDWEKRKATSVSSAAQGISQSDPSPKSEPKRKADVTNDLAGKLTTSAADKLKSLQSAPAPVPKSPEKKRSSQSTSK